MNNEPTMPITTSETVNPTETRTAICSICGQVIDLDNDSFEEYGGEYCCSDCYDDGAILCDGCHHWVSGEECHHVENTDEYVCDSCADNYYRCDHCGGLFSYSGITYFANHNYRTICNDCAEDYVECCGCGDATHVDDAYNHYDAWYCRNCYQDLKRNDLEEYCTSRCKPLPIFHGDSHLQMGFELETEYANGDICASIRRFLGEDEVYFKGDGSLDDMTGIEFVTHPGDLDYYRSDFPMEKFLRTIESYGGEATGACGLHVHVSRRAFAEDEYDEEGQNATIAKLHIIFAEHWDTILKFTRRGRDDYYWKMPEFTMPNRDIERRLFERVDNHYGSRYRSINNQNANTVEFRLFAATTDPVALLGTLQFVNNVVNYAKYHSIAQILDSTFYEVACYGGDDLVRPYMDKYGIEDSLPQILEGDTEVDDSDYDW